MSAMDRGLAYGDGVFRTLLIGDRMPQHWDRHLAKLQHDCARVGFVAPLAELTEDVRKVASDSGECVLKVIVTRGAGQRGYAYDAMTPTRIVMTAERPVYPHDYSTGGVRLRVCSLRLASQPALAGVKHLNRLENVLARAEWKDASVAEGILCDADGNVIGGTMTNLFISTDGILVTPRLDRCGVAGVTRDLVLEAAHELGIPTEVRTVSLDELRAADEICVGNSVIGIWPVRAVDDAPFAPGAITRQMQNALAGSIHARVA